MINVTNVYDFIDECKISFPNMLSINPFPKIFDFRGNRQWKKRY